MSLPKIKALIMLKIVGIVAVALISLCSYCYGQFLDKGQILRQQTYLDNRDFDWYEANIPFFECPDKEISTTYYYRWDLLTKHLTYGSPNSGYSFTEFIDRPFWSGAYGSISCPAGFQFYESRWLRTPRIANDYMRYWFRTPGAQPRNYSTWLADSAVAVDHVHPNHSLLVDLLPDLIRNYEGWEQRHFVPEVDLFWQTGHDDGMEFNILSRQTQDILRGAPSYRPSFNAYMWADAMAIAHIARCAGKPDIAERFTSKAESLKQKMIELMWDSKRQFFFPVLKNDEQRDGHTLKAMTRTYESGQFAGDAHGRELIGYVPWQFGLLKGDSRFDVAWKKLMERDGFYADFGPSTVERNDPMFLLQKSCCWWSGQSWPYATTQTLKALANYLQSGGKQLSVADYDTLLGIYSRSHRKDGKPYLAEALHPDTGSFEGHDGYNHSEHYFHSGYCDLVITGLVGLTTRVDDTLELRPLAPLEWDYFALEDVPYRGHLLSILWDKHGNRYGLGPGLHVHVDKKLVGSSLQLNRLEIAHAVPLVESTSATRGPVTTRTNFAVNNDGTYYPRVTASFTSKGTSLSKLNDGNYWYLLHPPNRWTCEGSPNAQDTIEIDFGVERPIDLVKLLVLDDQEAANSSSVRAPLNVKLEAWVGDVWQDVDAELQPNRPAGHRPLSLKFAVMQTSKLRVTLTHDSESRSGLTELEAWGDAELPLEPVSPPSGNLAFNDGSQEYPVATASHHDRFGGVPQSAIDGITNFLASPVNRWTSYESKTETDWLEINFGKSVEFRRVELAIYDDRGGVQAPIQYEIEVWNGDAWSDVKNAQKTPEKPAGSQWNSATFAPVTSEKLRITFVNAGKARSGVSEVMVWNDSPSSK
jgi:F5/8 type C domain